MMAYIHRRRRDALPRDEHMLIYTPFSVMPLLLPFSAALLIISPREFILFPAPTLVDLNFVLISATLAAFAAPHRHDLRH